MGEEFILDLM